MSLRVTDSAHFMVAVGRGGHRQGGTREEVTRLKAPSTLSLCRGTPRRWRAIQTRRAKFTLSPAPEGFEGILPKIREEAESGE